MATTDSPIPPEVVVPIIEAYAQGIRPAFSFILISAIFSAILIPLLVMLFVLSTPNSRRTPIFILNVLSICLGLLVGAMCGHLTITSILSPFIGVNATENLVFNVVYIWMPWVTGAILILRVVAVYRPLWPRLANLAVLLAFPMTLKVVRAAVNIYFLAIWRHDTSSGGAVNQFDVTKALSTWVIKTSWILELFDNAYISILFLWRLGVGTHLVFQGAKVGRVDSRLSGNSFARRVRSLFWIASTNFVFPLIFGLCQIILLFVADDILIAASVEMVNVYVSIISTVFATIWASTMSSRQPIGLSSSRRTESDRDTRFQHLEPMQFRTGLEDQATIFTDLEAGQHSSTELRSMSKSGEWESKPVIQTT